MKGFYNEMSVNEVLDNVNLIGIAGVAGSGKDTFAEIIKHPWFEGHVDEKLNEEFDYLDM